MKTTAFLSDLIVKHCGRINRRVRLTSSILGARDITLVNIRLGTNSLDDVSFNSSESVDVSPAGIRKKLHVLGTLLI